MRPLRAEKLLLHRAPVWGAVALVALPLGPAVAQCPPTVHVPAVVDGEDEFGASVALDGDVLVAGNPRRLKAFFDGDSAVVWRRVSGSWVEEAELLPSAPGGAVNFGHAVAVAGDTILVGDPGADGAAHFTGAVHVFEHSGGQWAETQKLFEAGGKDSDQFGFAVALTADGDRAVIGAPHFVDAGRVLVYERQGGVFTLAATILDPSAFGFAGSGWNFGSSVDVGGDRIAIGNPLSKSGPFVANGAAYVFELEGATWKQKAKLSPTNGVRTGVSIALSGDVLAVGAPGDSGEYPSIPSTNRVFVYRRSGSSWSQETLASPSPSSGAHVGWSVDVDGELLAYGEPTATSQAGRVRVHRFDGTAWQPLATFDGGAADDQLGRGVALAAGLVALGAPQAHTGAVPGFGTPLTTSKGPGEVWVAPVPQGPDLFATPDVLSLATGGTQTLALTTCPAKPGELYLLLGSLSGTSPGIPVDGLVLPLALDPYTLYLLANPNPPHLPGSFGTLDGTGAGSAQLLLPAGSSPGWAGAVFHHAFAVLAVAAGPQVVQVSGAAGLTLVP
jgi:hypothetical protein